MGVKNRCGLHLVILASLFVLSGCREAEKSTSAQIEKARQLFQLGEAANALTAVNAAIQVDGKNKDARFLAAEINESLGDLKAAFAEYTRADQLDPNEHRARIKLIDVLIAANLVDAATTRVNAALGDQPGSIDLLARRALLESRQDNIVKARVDASAVLAAAPGDAVGNAVLADLWLREKRFDLALVNVTQGLAAHPDDPPLLRLQASAFLAQGAAGKALASYAAIVAKMPRSVVDRTALAELQAQTGAITAGETSLREGVAAAPGNRPMRLQLASYLLRRRSAAAAEAELRAAIPTAPSDNAYDLALADILARDGQLDGAADTLKAAVARLSEGPAKSGAMVGHARVLAMQNQIDAARAELDQVLKADARNDEALLLRAELTLQLRETGLAIADLLAVTARRPASAEPFLRLANAYFQAGKVEDAVDAFKRVADLHPADVSVALRLSAFCQQAGRSDCAQQAIADLLARNPRSLEGRVAQIRLAAAGKDWQAAQTGLAELRRLPQAADAAMSLQAELDEAQGRLDEALTSYERLIGGTGSRPFDGRSAESFVRTSLAANRGPAAAEVLSKLARSDTPATAVPAGLALSGLYQTLGRSADALAAAQSVTRAAPADPAGYLMTAALQRQGKQDDQAAQVLNAGIVAGAPSEPLLAARAELESAAGRTGTAIETYDDILKAEPNSVAAANNALSLLADQKPLDRARLSDARAVLVKLPYGGSPAILDTIAWADYRLGDFASAKSLLLRAQADSIQLPQMRYHLGAVMIALGDKADGRALIKTVLNRDFPGRTEAQSLVVD